MKPIKVNQKIASLGADLNAAEKAENYWMQKYLQIQIVFWKVVQIEYPETRKEPVYYDHVTQTIKPKSMLKKDLEKEGEQ